MAQNSAIRDDTSTVDQPRSTARRLCAGLFFLAIVEPSLSIAYRYLGPSGVVLGILLGAAAAFWLPRRPMAMVARLSPRTAEWCAFAVLVVVLAIALFVYPAANVHAPMQGSDRDDALADATSALLHGRYPYARPTYLGNPITPLPGALVLAIPFVLARNVGLANVFWLAALFLLLRWSLGDARPALVATAIPLVSPEVVHEIATGGDMFANGVYVALFMLLVARVVGDSRSRPLAKAGAAALFGLGLSSRLTYPLIVPAAFQYLRLRIGARSAAAWLSVTVLVFVATTVPFYLMSPAQFAPLHLAGKVGRAGPLIPHADLVLPGFSVAFSLVSSRWPITTPRALCVTAGAIVGFPTYLLLAAYLAGPAPRGAIQYFAAGLSATGLYVVSFGLFLTRLADIANRTESPANGGERSGSEYGK